MSLYGSNSIKSTAALNSVSNEAGISRQTIASDFRRRVLFALLHTRPLIVGICVIVPAVAISIFANQLAPYEVSQINTKDILQGPSPMHWLGTDALGHDMYSQIIFGSRISLQVGVFSVLASLLIGTLLGLVSGFRGGKFDEGVMWVMDTLLVFPSLVLALTITAFIGPSLWNIIIALAITFVPAGTRLVRGQVLVLREFDFVLASKSIGVPEWRILIRHILPHVMALIAIQGAASTGAAIIAEASLSFLGMGVPPPTPSWGRMLQEGYSYLLINPWISIAPGAAIFLLVFGFTTMADGIRDFIHRADTL